MKGEEFLDAMEHLDPELIQTADELPQKRRHGRVSRWIAAAACLVLVCGAGLGIRAYAAEQREYRQALSFFEENDLSTDGLTRKEIKAVYRDIITQRFEDAKTSEVMQNSLMQELPGYEISRKPLTPQMLESLWRYKLHMPLATEQPKPDSITYRVDWIHREEPLADGSTFVGSKISQYRGENQVWSAYLPGYFIDEYRSVQEGLLVWGCHYTDAIYLEEDERPAPVDHLIKLDTQGAVLWDVTMGTSAEYERIHQVLENPDGSCTVFSQTDAWGIVMTRLLSDGSKKDQFHVLEAPCAIRNGAKLGEDYLLQIQDDGGSRLLRVDPEGQQTDEFCYKGTDADYFITDMQEFGGQLYLSAYAMPHSPYTSELGRISGDMEPAELEKLSSEEFTEMMRPHYTAVLLVSNAQDFTPREFYSVKGSLGGRLQLNAQEELVWEVESILDAEPTLMLSSSQMAGVCAVYHYTFLQDGTLRNQDLTDELRYFTR